jgi:hypothetical protein
MQIADRILPLVLASALGAGTACETAERFTADRDLDSVIGANGAIDITLDFAVPVDVVGIARRDEVTVRGVVTVTTSSQAISDRLAEGLVVETEFEGSALRVTLAQPGAGAGTEFAEATLSGQLDITVPADADVTLFERGGTARVRRVMGAIDVRAVGAVVIEDAEDDVTVRTEVGGARIETDLASGSVTTISVGSGDIDLILPGVLSARLRAEAPSGDVIVVHPELPAPIPGRLYDVVVRGGSASVVAVAERGSVRLRL